MDVVVVVVACGVGTFQIGNDAPCHAQPSSSCLPSLAFVTFLSSLSLSVSSLCLLSLSPFSVSLLLLVLDSMMIHTCTHTNNTARASMDLHGHTLGSKHRQKSQK